MSDIIKHECGIAFVRLLKPLSYFQEKYGDKFYGLKKMYILMEKQKNRGQDGAGLATLKINVPQGMPYIDRVRKSGKESIQEIFETIYRQFDHLTETETRQIEDAEYLQNKYAFMGDIYLGHLRYATHGDNQFANLHPRIRANNWKTRNLVVAGNFNLTNVNELFDTLVKLGQYPREKSDTMTVLEKIGHFLDVENDRLYKKYKKRGIKKRDITPIIATKLNFNKILKPSSNDFDGGYVMAGMIGHGDAFVMRDPNGIRPAYYYNDDEIVVVASERPAIQSAFNVHRSKIKEIGLGNALIVKMDGSVGEVNFQEPRERKSCSFERIYFSRGNDFEIYKERKALGRLLVDKVLKAVDYNLKDTVFSYIPNTAEIAFLGMVEEVRKVFINSNLEKFEAKEISYEDFKDNLSFEPRIEKIAIKDAKLRTFITGDNSRNSLVSHVYDVTYGLVKNNIDTLVVLDDSIVRGTTLEESILSILDRLAPKRIIVVSSAPQIRYPDCYGIDMSKLGNFVAFRAAIALWKEESKEDGLKKIYEDCLDELTKPPEEMENLVKQIYDPYTPEQISQKIAEIVRPNHIFSQVSVIYQSVENLHIACPLNLGDWYFTGNYPTPGGNRVVLRAFKNFYEGNNVRAY
ncbi:MAG: amidophosphoribosyltransferase [Chitinophagales bacterium]